MASQGIQGHTATYNFKDTSTTTCNFAIDSRDDTIEHAALMIPDEGETSRVHPGECHVPHAVSAACAVMKDMCTYSNDCICVHKQ